MELKLLALETSSSRCSVALLHATGGRLAIEVREHEGAQEHAERLLPMVDELLVQAGLTPDALQAVAFGQGPGGFTGLRVACGVAQGMAMGLGIPVLPVVSHQAVATQADGGPDDAIVVALDARMHEVYLAVYRQPVAAAGESVWETLQAPLLIAATEVVPWTAHHLPGWSRAAGRSLAPILAGDAWDAYAVDMFIPAGWRRAVRAQRPEAASVARLARLAWLRGEALPPEQAAPRYVRDKVAFTTAERLRGAGGNPKAQSTLAPVPPRALTDMDLDEVAALEASVQPFPWTRGNFVDALAAGYGAWTLRREGRLAGFCILMFAPDVAHLLVIAVARDWHRQGLGSVLLDWCEQQARERGLEGVLLEVRPSNASAVAFYRARGYLRIGLRRDYYPAGKGRREDAWVMQKCLDASVAATAAGAAA